MSLNYVLGFVDMAHRKKDFHSEHCTNLGISPPNPLSFSINPFAKYA